MKTKINNHTIRRRNVATVALKEPTRQRKMPVNCRRLTLMIEVTCMFTLKPKPKIFNMHSIENRMVSAVLIFRVMSSYNCVSSFWYGVNRCMQQHASV